MKRKLTRIFESSIYSQILNNSGSETETEVYLASEIRFHLNYWGGCMVLTQECTSRSS